jgi:hypothetical protein
MIDFSKVEELRGKTVVGIGPPNIRSPQCVVQVSCSDGTAFRILSGKCGSWVEPASLNLRYDKFRNFIRDIGQHTYFDEARTSEGDPIIEFTLGGEELRARTFDGLEFVLELESLGSGLKRLIRHERGLGLMLDAVVTVELWGVLFEGDHIPLEIRLSPSEIYGEDV